MFGFVFKIFCEEISFKFIVKKVIIMIFCGWSVIKKKIMKKVLIVGGIGLIGSCLSFLLIVGGYEVVYLSWKIGGNFKYFIYYWDLMKGLID